MLTVNCGEEPCQRLTVLIVSSGEYAEQLKSALLAENKLKYKDNLNYCFCEHVEDVLRWMEQNGKKPDYTVIVVDPKIRTSLQIAEDNIQKIDPTFLYGGRLCLVNGSCSIKPSEMGVEINHISVLAQKYSAILINGDVGKPEKCRHLASRISGLATSVCGYFTGIPVVVDIPGYE